MIFSFEEVVLEFYRLSEIHSTARHALRPDIAPPAPLTNVRAITLASGIDRYTGIQNQDTQRGTECMSQLAFGAQSHHSQWHQHGRRRSPAVIERTEAPLFERVNPSFLSAHIYWIT